MEDRSTRVDRAVSCPDFVSPQLAAAMSHPTRVRAMSILSDRIASPRELAAEMDEPLNNVTYHVNQLRKLDCIELVRTEPVRGGRVVEHFYRACRRSYFDDAAWGALSEKERYGVVGAIVAMISKDIAESMAAGTFFTDGDVHACRSVVHVDDEGWRELLGLIERATDELFEIEDRVAARGAEGKPAPITAKLDILQYRLPGRA
ncbi:MAG TPA: helix-turn-helix domain-containing protein [Solirubrobacterales bacterium]|nr:helix-turn-helix domain-containing protein [Solirubrobacterales bacterium]